MAHILICILDQHGHLNPTLRLASTLIEKGHRVTYVGRWEQSPEALRDRHWDSDVARRIRALGYDFLPFSERLLKRCRAPRWNHKLAIRARIRIHGPELLQDPRKKITDLGLKILQGLHDRWSQWFKPSVQSSAPAALKLKNLSQHLRSGSIADDLRALRPDLCLIDIFGDHIIFFAIRALGVPYLRYSTTLPQAGRDKIPPLDSLLPPATDKESLRRVRIDWLRVYAGKWTTPRMAGAQLAILRKARQAGIPLRHFDFSAELFPYLYNDAPMLVFCPREFDFPRPDDPLVVYAEASIQEEGDALDPSWQEWLDSRATLVLCSFGTQLKRYQTSRIDRIITGLLRFAECRADCQLVISAGELADTSIRSLPKNVRLCGWVPQRGLLERAGVLVTHGGLASIKEAILQGVPILAVPQDKDQLGNAARVAFHKLGFALDHKTQTTDKIAKCLERLTEPAIEIREQLSRFQDAFRRAEYEHIAYFYIKSFLNAQGLDR